LGALSSATAQQVTIPKWHRRYP